MTELEERCIMALEGIASCATRCGCCEMHRRIAEEVLTAAHVRAKPRVVEDDYSPVPGTRCEGCEY